MAQSSLHIGIIMDGNGRWATARGLPRIAGHREGGKALRRTIEAAVELGVGAVTLYAFSSDNWKRPPEEVAGLMTLFRQYLKSEVRACRSEGVRLSFIGRRDRLPAGLVDLLARAERETHDCQRLHVRIAMDYSSRDTLVEAAKRAGAGASRAAIADALPAPDVDLLIRTGGEQRLSDFLLWECAYAELVFLPTMWPEFGREHLEQALASFRSRERRFGAAPAA